MSASMPRDDAGFFAIAMPKTSLRVVGETPQTALHRIFGYPSFRDDQENIVQHLAAGGSAFVLKSTGGGKSICFQLPGLIRDGMTIVISPLIALMKDQVETLRRRGIRAAALVHANAMEEVERGEIEAAVTAGNLDVLYVSPERLQVPSFRRLISRLKISLIAVDECHCISSWGHDFRDSYLVIDAFLALLPDVPVIALTATADPVTQADIIAKLGLTGARVFKSSFDRPNIEIRVQRRFSLPSDLVDILEAHKGENGIIFCPTQKLVEETTEQLLHRGFNVIGYHAGMGSDQRKLAQETFIASDGIVAVATIAFGMGIDKPDIRFVVHTSMPSTAEGYYQEIGRAGRDGRPSIAYLLYRMADTTNSMRHLVNRLGELPEDQTQARQRVFVEIQKMQDMIGFIESGQCRRRSILHLFGEECTEACGNCDRCKQPEQLNDHSNEAQLLIKTIASTGQRFGANYIIEILQGLPTERVLSNEHEHLSSYGAGKATGKRDWQMYLRQLRIEGFLEPDINGVIRLGQKAWPFLRGQGKVLLTGGRIRRPEVVRLLGNGLPPATQRRLTALIDWRNSQGEACQALFPNRVVERLIASPPNDPAELSGRLARPADVTVLREVMAILQKEKPPVDGGFEEISIF